MQDVERQYRIDCIAPDCGSSQPKKVLERITRYCIPQTKVARDDLQGWWKSPKAMWTAKGTDGLLLVSALPRQLFCVLVVCKPSNPRVQGLSVERWPNLDREFQVCSNQTGKIEAIRWMSLVLTGHTLARRSLPGNASIRISVAQVAFHHGRDKQGSLEMCRRISRPGLSSYIWHSA